VQVGATAHLLFDNGDCHVKSGHRAGDAIYVVKVAASFYANAVRGIGTNQGFMAVIDAGTGEVRAILHDQGELTARRTAMAGLLAARAIVRPGSRVLGVVGTGVQARLQGEMLARHLGFDDILVWGREPDHAAALAGALNGRATDLETLCRTADLIVTATPSQEPLVRDAWVRPGTRLIAVGADGGGKQELETALTGRATLVVDSRDQCVADGETGWAVRADLVDPAEPITLAGLLATPRVFPDETVVIADLTGLAVEDVAIAGTVWRALQQKPR
jgi:ornithine cyclodeaminase